MSPFHSLINSFITADVSKFLKIADVSIKFDVLIELVKNVQIWGGSTYRNWY